MEWPDIRYDEMLWMMMTMIERKCMFSVLFTQLKIRGDSFKGEQKHSVVILLFCCFGAYSLRVSTRHNPQAFSDLFFLSLSSSSFSSWASFFGVKSNKEKHMAELRRNMGRAFAHARMHAFYRNFKVCVCACSS